MTYDSIYDDESNLWSVLYQTGYLTRTRQPDNEKITLRLPNREVRKIFTETVTQWFRESVARKDMSLFVDALWGCDASRVQTILTDMLYETVSYFDSQENYYYGFLVGLLRGAGLAVQSNREEGLGRPDIILEDGRNKRALFVEVKTVGEYESLEAKARDALRQIEERSYAKGLGPQIRKIIKYGIAFWKKECSVAVQECSR